MKASKLFVVGTFIFATLLITTSDISAQNRQVLAKVQQTTGDQFPFSARTPRGANVYSVNRPNSQILAAIDKGLTDLFAVARKNRYRKRLNYSEYTVFIAKPDREKNAAGNYSPDIAVGAAQYAGSEYDKGGYIYASGMVIAFSPMTFVIADHTKELSRVSEIVRYEGEHLVLYHNDRRRYNETADHSQGGGHPILK